MSKKPDLSGYNYGAISSLVLTTDRSALPRRDKEPDGSPVSLAGRIDPKDMGSGRREWCAGSLLTETLSFVKHRVAGVIEVFTQELFAVIHVLSLVREVNCALASGVVCYIFDACLWESVYYW